MSNLWHASVLRRRDASLRLKVTKTHPDGGMPQLSKTFVMRLLADRAMYSEGDAKVADLGYLSRRLGPLNNLNDTAEAVAIGREAIRTLDIIERANEKVNFEKLAENLSPEEWQELRKDLDRLPSSTYSLTFSDPKWIEDLEAGTEWDSAAY